MANLKIDLSDRRWIYLLTIGLIVMLIFAAELGFVLPDYPPLALEQQNYDIMTALTTSDTVLTMLTHSTDSYFDGGPAGVVAMKYLEMKKIPMILIATSGTSRSIGFRMVQFIWGEDFGNHPEYGKSLVFLGYIPGGYGALPSFSRDLRSVFSVDYFGTPIEDLPMLKNVNSFNDIKLVLCMWSGVSTLSGIKTTEFPDLQLGCYGSSSLLGYFGMWVTSSMTLDHLNCGSKMGYIFAKQTGVPLDDLRQVVDYSTEDIFFPQCALAIAAFLGIIVSNINYFRYRRREAK
jgi:hypothetical protein